MELALSIAVGTLVGGGIYLMLRRSLVRLILGVALLGSGANLLIFVASDPERGRPPLIPEGEKALAEGTSDPLAQALVLTAIVIAFGVLAYTVTLAKRVHQETNDDALDAWEEGDAP